MVLGGAKNYFKIRSTTEVRTSAPLCFFKDNRVAAILYGALKIWDVEKGAFVGKSFGGFVHSIAVSPDGRKISCGAYNGIVTILDVKSMQTSQLVKHTSCVQSMCFSPDGKRLASASDDSTIVVWDVETCSVIATLQGHDNSVMSVAFSPDGLKLASASSWDGTIRVWCPHSAKLLLIINDLGDPDNVVWSPDGQQLVVSSGKTVEFWDPSTGLLIGQPCTGHTKPIRSLSISSDGSFVATASFDMTVRLWSTQSHQQIGQALKHDNYIPCVTISPNGELIATGLTKKNKLWLWSIKEILELHCTQERQLEIMLRQRLSNLVSISLHFSSGI